MVSLPRLEDNEPNRVRSIDKIEKYLLFTLKYTFDPLINMIVK